MTRPTDPSTTMRAAVLTGPRTLRIDNVARPVAGPGEVLVRMEGCGVCASNVTPWLGPEWMQYPTAPGALGHEGWGVVEACGEGVGDLHPGDRVALIAHNSYAEYDVAPAAQAVRLPAALAGQPFPGEPIACALNILARSRIRPGDTVAVVGVGFLGALLVRLAADAGVRVVAIARRIEALDLARAMGAAETVVMDDHHRIIETVSGLTGGRFCAVVIEAAGHQWPLDLAAELTAERGTLVIAGYHQDGPRQVNMQLWNWRGLDVVNAHERDTAVYVSGLAAAVDAVAGGRLDPTPLYTHRYPLDRLDEALDATHTHPDGFVKALVTFP